ncbi:galactose-binding like protein [Xylona heveae TC161]|uniref:Galactose-binding like protein n=1 Tax=Xylona heveae (strain CBS 132557 / TC161) TaxID=1328760 RepID=A0A161TPF0_XYLHT|nr:galactose-binding like protein [Xylona heveae TC161]KZF24066.1 galactose-binding like protein [Xylona heveae TC161]
MTIAQKQVFYLVFPSRLLFPLFSALQFPPGSSLSQTNQLIFSSLNQTEKSHPLPLTGLKEISSLASWTVSSCKPGCGVGALRSPSTSDFWQSDGPQPHLVNIHFFKLVCIAHIRIYLDFDADESYTPTKMQLLAGTGPHDLQEFIQLSFEQPRGWIDVDLTGVGGRDSTAGGTGRHQPPPAAPVTDPATGATEDASAAAAARLGADGNVLRAFLLQLRITENHQNGKDTHLRGLQIFARDHSTDTVHDLELDNQVHASGHRSARRRVRRGSQGINSSDSGEVTSGDENDNDDDENASNATSDTSGSPVKTPDWTKPPLRKNMHRSGSGSGGGGGGGSTSRFKEEDMNDFDDDDDAQGGAPGSGPASVPRARRQRHRPLPLPLTAGLEEPEWMREPELR